MFNSPLGKCQVRDHSRTLNTKREETSGGKKGDGSKQARKGVAHTLQNRHARKGRMNAQQPGRGHTEEKRREKKIKKEDIFRKGERDSKQAQPDGLQTT
jgi:hypothetical protein